MDSYIYKFLCRESEKVNEIE